MSDNPMEPPSITFEIVLQEEGIDDTIKESLMREASKLPTETLKKRWEIFMKYLNNRVKQPTKEKNDGTTPRR